MGSIARAPSFALVMTLLGGCGDTPQYQGTCNPSFLVESNKPIELDLGAVAIRAELTLIGCADDLRGISPSEKEAIESAIYDFAVSSPMDFFAQAQDPEYREGLSDVANRVLGRPAVTDVLLSNRSYMDIHQ